MANDLLTRLRTLTDSRIGLERAGGSLTTGDWLALRAAHAAARDAIHAVSGQPVIPPPVGYVRSRCQNRQQYLLRPDLGRRLADDAELPTGPFDIALVVADGLSPLAVSRHAAGLVGALRNSLAEARLTVSPVIQVAQGRVAIGDEIGERLQARLTAMLIGERPGLSAADSLGVYLTYAPKAGRTDAERNCISNIRDGGLDIPLAARRTINLIEAALARQLTGVQLKESAHALKPAMAPALAGPLDRLPPDEIA